VSPILDLQRRLVEVGRVRLGMKKTSQNGKSYPARLEQFRLTSRDKQRLDAAAVLYGGEVKKWDEQWELFTETDVLPIAVVPGQALTQSYEMWGQKNLGGNRKSAVICLRRCDSVTEALSGASCLCADEDELACKPTTRLSVVLTEVPGLGVWRCEVHGWNAAMELAGSVALLESLVAAGRPVRARLRLDKREKKTETETRNFVVPVLDIDHTLGQVLDALGAGHMAPPAIERAQPAAIDAPRGFTPVPPAAIGAPAPSIADQITQPLAKTPRSNAAEPIKKSGRRARVENVGVDTAVFPAGGAPAPSGSSPGAPSEDDAGEPTNEGAPAGDGDGVDETSAASPASSSSVAAARAKSVAIACRDIGIEKDEQRHEFIALVTDGRAANGHELDDRDFALVKEAVGRVKAGRLELVHTVEGWLALREPAPATAGSGSEDPAWWDTDRWLKFAQEHGKTKAAVLRKARAIAEELGDVPLPPAFGEWTDGRVAAGLVNWLEGENA
jgi:hypothetical protein